MVTKTTESHCGELINKLSTLEEIKFVGGSWLSNGVEATIRFKGQDYEITIKPSNLSTKK